MSKKDRTEIILEDMNGKFDVMLEFVQVIPEMNRRLKNVEADVSELKSDMKVVKAVLRVHSADIVELKAKTAHL